jgi:hypothetical protein
MKVCKLFLVVLAVFIVIGCASESDKAVPKTETSKIAADTEMSDEDAIRNTLTELIVRTKEGDKTVMYENEFEYYRLQHSLDEYYELDRVRLYKYDTLKSIEIDSVDLMGDSAEAYIKIVYESVLGGETKRPYSIMVYRSGGRWIKPYQSNIRDELEFRALNAPLEDIE